MIAARFWSNVVDLAPLWGALLIFLIWQMAAAIRADRHRTAQRIDAARRAQAIADARERVKQRRP